MENPIKMDDLGVPLFLETPISTASNISRAFWVSIRQNITGVSHSMVDIMNSLGKTWSYYQRFANIRIPILVVSPLLE